MWFLTWGLRKEWSENFIEQSIYKRIWRRTALLNGTRIADTYALDPLDPLGCWHLCILYHWPCWHFVSFGLLRCKSQNFSFLFFFGSCYSNSLDIENTVATRNYYFILKNTRWIKKKYFFSFFLTPSLATHQREQMQATLLS